MNSMEEKAFFIEQYADSPAWISPFCHCFFRLIILRDSGMSRLFAFLSISSGVVSSLSEKLCCSNRASKDS